MRNALSKSSFFLTLFVFTIQTVSAQLQLPVVFGDNAVLQQQTDVNIWGTDKPNSKIVVKGSWGKEAKTTTDVSGKWRLKMQTPAAGGPYTLSVNGSTQVVSKNVLIGEVWLCSGQSNMGMTLNGYYNQPVLGSNEAIATSKNDNIRMFTQQRSASLTPLNDMKGDWQMASPATVGKFSAVAYFFAKKLQATLGVPVGIIHTSWGGSPVESWMDLPSLQGFKHNPITDTLPKTNPHRIPTVLYNGMLHPFIGYTLKGMLWYQGEANRENHQDYQGMFTRMITSWRQQWQQGDFPFYFVQIAPFGYPAPSNAAYLREAQQKTAQSVANTGMAVTMDVGEEKLIHPAEKQTIGNRLAYLALTKDYGIQGITFSGPVYKGMQKTDNNRIVVRFDHAATGLTSFGKPLTDFEIAGEDRVFYPAQVAINDDKNPGITVWSDSVKNPVSVRYAFKSWAMGSLFNTQGLPASSFRTDDWEPTPAKK